MIKLLNKNSNFSYLSKNWCCTPTICLRLEFLLNIMISVDKLENGPNPNEIM